MIVDRSTHGCARKHRREQGRGQQWLGHGRYAPTQLTVWTARANPDVAVILEIRRDLPWQIPFPGRAQGRNTNAIISNRHARACRGHPRLGPYTK
jgi:hypothetical protein